MINEPGTTFKTVPRYVQFPFQNQDFEYLNPRQRPAAFDLLGSTKTAATAGRQLGPPYNCSAASSFPHVLARSIEDPYLDLHIAKCGSEPESQIHVVVLLGGAWDNLLSQIS